MERHLDGGAPCRRRGGLAGFTLGVSADAATWKTVATEAELSVTAADAVTWGFPVETARYVRLAVTDTGVSYDKHYVILAELEVYSAAASDGQAQLTWLGPGDDGMTGRPRATSSTASRAPSPSKSSPAHGITPDVTEAQLHPLVAKAIAGL